MKRTTVISVVVLMLILSGIGGFAGAQTSPDGRMMGPAHGMMGFSRASADRPLITLMLDHQQDLSLSAEQVRSLEVIRSDFQQEAAQRITELEAAEKELDVLLRQVPVDLSRVEATLRKIEGLKVALRLGRIKAIDQGRALLSTDQENRLQALLEQRDLPSRRQRG